MGKNVQLWRRKLGTLHKTQIVPIYGSNSWNILFWKPVREYTLLVKFCGTNGTDSLPALRAFVNMFLPDSGVPASLCLVPAHYGTGARQRPQKLPVCKTRSFEGRRRFLCFSVGIRSLPETLADVVSSDNIWASRDAQGPGRDARGERYSTSFCPLVGTGTDMGRSGIGLPPLAPPWVRGRDEAGRHCGRRTPLATCRCHP